MSDLLRSYRANGIRYRFTSIGLVVPSGPVFANAGTTGPRVSSLTTMEVGMTAANTGVGAGWECKSGGYGTGLYMDGTGASISGFNIPYACLISTNDAVIRDCILTCDGPPNFSDSVIAITGARPVIEYCIIQGKDYSAAGNGGKQIANNNTTQNGIFDASGSYKADPRVQYCEMRYTNHNGNVTSGIWSHNYCHNLGNNKLDSNGKGTSHSDCIYAGGGDPKPWTLVGNYMVNDDHDAPAAAINFATDFGDQANITCTGNLFGGGSFCIYPGVDPDRSIYPSNFQFSHNWFTTSVYPYGGDSGTSFGSPGVFRHDPYNGVNGCEAIDNRWYDGARAGQLV